MFKMYQLHENFKQIDDNVKVQKLKNFKGTLIFTSLYTIYLT